MLVTTPAEPKTNHLLGILRAVLGFSPARCLRLGLAREPALAFGLVHLASAVVGTAWDVVCFLSCLVADVALDTSVTGIPRIAHGRLCWFWWRLSP